MGMRRKTFFLLVSIGGSSEKDLGSEARAREFGCNMARCLVVIKAGGDASASF
jgi:hypothetical protein